MHTGPNIERDGLVFGYDTGYGVVNNSTATRFYLGEPTTNLQSSNQTSGQIAGMAGVSLTYVGEENGYSKYSMSGTFSSGTYPYCMYLPGVSFTGGIAYSTQVKLKTNVPHKFNYIGGGINYVNQPKNSDGISSSVLQSDGFNYIKREGFNYVSTTTQAGYIFSNPINNTTFNSSTDFIYIKDFQIEQKTYSTIHTPTSRSNTQSLIDLTKTTDIDVSNISFDSTGQPTFDGTNDYIDLPNSLGYTDEVSVFAIFKSNGIPPGNYHIICGGSQLEMSIPTSGALRTGVIASTRFVSNAGSGLTDGNYHHIGFTYSNNLKRAYINGQQVGTQTTTGTLVNSFSNRRIGRFGSSGGYYLNGNLPVLKVYNRAISANEIQQNYNAYKSRFNI